jgi:M6 family metalloprotease-like protein
MRPAVKTVTAWFLFGGFTLHAGVPCAPPADLGEYHTTREAIRASVHALSPGVEGQTGYLGVSVEPDPSGGLVIAEIGPGSPAASAGLEKGDRLVAVDSKPVGSAGELRTIVQAKSPGEVLPLTVERTGAKRELTARLEATSQPLQLGERAILGLRMANASDAPGIQVVGIGRNQPAARAGIRPGDRIMSVDGNELGEARSLSDALLEKRPGDTVDLIVRHRAQERELRVALVADESDSALLPEQRRVLTTWKQPVFRLAVLCVEFADVKHNPRVPLEEWERAYFSRDAYRQTNATGQRVYGSMTDYYQEVSCGKLRVEGKVFDWVAAGKKRVEYNLPKNSKAKTEFLSEIVRAVTARDGREALNGFDGLAFIYAGPKLPEAQRGGSLWPHRGRVTIDGKPWSYVIVPEGGERMSTISTICHEFGHILGLPDLYARPENPGSEGAGVWSVMSNQFRNGRPQHFCAWGKEQMGWLSPVVIDPTVKQKLILGPVEGSDHECYKILVRPDGSEYFLLENRRKRGFDAGLPAEGLLIWRVVANRPILEEAHGIEGPAGPRVFLASVPWPGKNNHAFTPLTTPSSRSQLGGGLPVNLTNIRELTDGRILFQIGYEYE